jgi:hypothetical protein
MSKTLILATALIGLGMGAAFADGDVNAQPAQTATPSVQHPMPAHQAASNFFARQRSNVWVYDQFGTAGTAQGGEN